MVDLPPSAPPPPLPPDAELVVVAPVEVTAAGGFHPYTGPDPLAACGEFNAGTPCIPADTNNPWIGFDLGAQIEYPTGLYEARVVLMPPHPPSPPSPPPSPPPGAPPSPPPPPPPSPSPSPPTPAVPPMTHLCTRGGDRNDCVAGVVDYSHDGVCQDGGHDAAEALCSYGADHADCGSRGCSVYIENYSFEDTALAPSTVEVGAYHYFALPAEGGWTGVTASGAASEFASLAWTSMRGASTLWHYLGAGTCASSRGTHTVASVTTSHRGDYGTYQDMLQRCQQMCEQYQQCSGVSLHHDTSPHLGRCEIFAGGAIVSIPASPSDTVDCYRHRHGSIGPGSSSSSGHHQSIVMQYPMGIEQELSGFVVGQTYRLIADHAETGVLPGAPSMTMSVRDQATVIGSKTVSPTVQGWNDEWHAGTFSAFLCFTASRTTHTIRFAGDSTTDWVHVDNVEVRVDSVDNFCAQATGADTTAFPTASGLGLGRRLLDATASVLNSGLEETAPASPLAQYRRWTGTVDSSWTAVHYGYNPTTPAWLSNAFFGASPPPVAGGGAGGGASASALLLDWGCAADAYASGVAQRLTGLAPGTAYRVTFDVAGGGFMTRGQTADALALFDAGRLVAQADSFDTEQADESHRGLARVVDASGAAALALAPSRFAMGDRSPQRRTGSAPGVVADLGIATSGPTGWETYAGAAFGTRATGSFLLGSTVQSGAGVYDAGAHVVNVVGGGLCTTQGGTSGFEVTSLQPGALYRLTARVAGSRYENGRGLACNADYGSASPCCGQNSPALVPAGLRCPITAPICDGYSTSAGTVVVGACAGAGPAGEMAVAVREAVLAGTGEALAAALATTSYVTECDGSEASCTAWDAFSFDFTPPFGFESTGAGQCRGPTLTANQGAIVYTNVGDLAACRQHCRHQSTGCSGIEYRFSERRCETHVHPIDSTMDIGFDDECERMLVGGTVDARVEFETAAGNCIYLNELAVAAVPVHDRLDVAWAALADPPVSRCTRLTGTLALDQVGAGKRFAHFGGLEVGAATGNGVRVELRAQTTDALLGAWTLEGQATATATATATLDVGIGDLQGVYLLVDDLGDADGDYLYLEGGALSCEYDFDWQDGQGSAGVDSGYACATPADQPEQKLGRVDFTTSSGGYLANAWTTESFVFYARGTSVDLEFMRDAHQCVVVDNVRMETVAVEGRTTGGHDDVGWIELWVSRSLARTFLHCLEPSPAHAHTHTQR